MKTEKQLIEQKSTKEHLRDIWKRYISIKKKHPEIITEVKKTGGDLLPEIPESDRKNGKWFITLVKRVLDTHAKRVTYEYYREKYQTDTRDILAKRLITAYQNYALATGFLMGAVGGAGGLPTALMTAFPEIATLSFYQLRMIYDLSLVYGRKLNIDDPDEAIYILKAAFGIKSAELLNKGIAAGIGEGARSAAEGIATHISAKVSESVLEEIGLKLTRGAVRNTLLKSVPLAGSILGSGVAAVVNYKLTGIIAHHLIELFRTPERAAQIFESRNTITDTHHYEVLIKACWFMIHRAKKITINKSCLIDYIYSTKNIDEAFTSETRNRINIPRDEILTDLYDLHNPGIERSILTGLILTAIIDKKISREEKKILARMASILRLSKRELKKMISDIRRELFAL